YRQENPVPPPRVRPDSPPLLPPPTPPPAPAPPPAYQPEATPAAAPANAFDLPPPPAAPASAVMTFPHAPFQDRLAPFLLHLLLRAPAPQAPDSPRRDSDSAIFLLLLAYHIGFWTWKGTTVGGIICQLRVVRVDGAPLGFADALVRGLASIFSLAVLGIGALW